MGSNETRSSFQGGTRVTGHSTQRTTQGVSSLKGWEAKMDHKQIQDTFIYNKNDTIAGPLTPQQLYSFKINSVNKIETFL